MSLKQVYRPPSTTRKNYRRVRHTRAGVEPVETFVQGKLRLYLPSIAILMIGAAAAYCAVEIALHYTDNVVFSLQVGVIVLMLSPMVAFAAAKRAHVVGTKFYGGGFDFIVPVLSCTAVNLFVNILVNLSRGLTGLQLQPAEIYLFYVAIAVAEECTFRLLLVTFVVWGLVKLGSPYVKFNAITAGCISGFLFTLAHLDVYGNDPIEMFSVFLSGFVFSYFFAMTGNPLTCIVSHVLNNVLAASFMFATASMIAII